MEDSTTLIAGEPVELLREVLVTIRDQSPMKQLPDGSWQLWFELPAEQARPFWRAFLRVQAELMLAEADSQAGLDELRSSGERESAALATLVQRIALAGTDRL